MGGTVYLLSLFFGVPIGISLLVLKAGWLEIANAYAIWVPILLAGSILLGARNAAEVIGWAIIFGMFLTIPAIPIIIKLCRISGFTLPWLA